MVTTQHIVSPVPQLADEGVTLRLPRDADVDLLVEQCRDPEMRRWTGVRSGYGPEDGRAFVTRAHTDWQDPQGRRVWVVAASDEDGDDRYVGNLYLAPGAESDVATIGYSLHPDARGQGLMARALRLAAAYAFETGPWGEPLRRLQWSAVRGNWSSRRVAWATGFTGFVTTCGTHKNTAEPGGPALDTWHASLAADDPMVARTPWFEPVPLEGDGVRLRPWREEDVEALEEPRHEEHWFPSSSVLSPGAFPTWLERRRELMAEGRAVEWCIADGQSDRALGQVTLFDKSGPLTGDVAELGYQVLPSARGRGVATAASRLALEHARAPREDGGLGLRRVVASTAADNAASNAVLRACGFEVWGREHAVDALPDGTYADLLHWGLLPRE